MKSEEAKREGSLVRREEEQVEGNHDEEVGENQTTLEIAPIPELFDFEDEAEFQQLVSIFNF